MNSKVYTWVIVALVCLNLFTCTRSCNRTRSLKEQMNVVLQKDSIISDAEKRCDSLRNIISLKNAEIACIGGDVDFKVAASIILHIP